MRYLIALLMVLTHKKENHPQGTLASIVRWARPPYPGTFQLWIKCRQTLPTATQISKEMADTQTKEGFKIVPEQDAGDVFIDGTCCPGQRPAKKDGKTDEVLGERRDSQTTRTCMPIWVGS